MPIPRFRIRTLMIAVVVVGLGLFACRIHNTRSARLKYANYLATLERQLASYGSSHPNDRFGVEGFAWGRMMPVPDLLVELAKTRHRYERAACRPWRPVPPDPPPPE